MIEIKNDCDIYDIQSNYKVTVNAFYCQISWIKNDDSKKMTYLVKS